MAATGKSTPEPDQGTDGTPQGVLPRHGRRFRSAEPGEVGRVPGWEVRAGGRGGLEGPQAAGWSPTGEADSGFRYSKCRFKVRKCRSKRFQLRSATP